MTILSKACKPDNFESDNSLKLSFTNIWGLRPNFVDSESFLESNSPDILDLYEIKMDDSIDSGNFSVTGYLPLIWKDSSTHMHGLAVYVKEGLPFARDLSLENSADSYLCFRLALLHSVSYFFFLYRSPSSTLCTVFDSISFKIDEVLSINPSAVFAFGDFNNHHKGYLTYSGGTDRSVELCYRFNISNNLTQMVNFSALIPDCDSHSPTLLDFYFFLLMLVFVLQWLSFHWEILMILLFQFPLTFHHIHNKIPFFFALLMTILVLTGMVLMIIWEMFHGRISLNSLFLLLVNFVSWFRLELMYISFTKSIRSSFTHLHGFHLLVLLP